MAGLCFDIESERNEQAKKEKFYSFKGIVSRDWKGLQMVSLDRFEVLRIPLYVYF
jgi:hypothetical protein